MKKFKFHYNTIGDCFYDIYCQPNCTKKEDLLKDMAGILNGELTPEDFKKEILIGIPNELPKKQEYDTSINHAPIRENILNAEEKKLALRNALRYFDKKFHKKLNQVKTFSN